MILVIINTIIIMGELRDKMIIGIKWGAIGKFATQGVNFIIGLVLARLLTPQDYGVVGMVAIFFAIAQTFIDGGFGSAIIRKEDCTEGDYSTAFYINVLVALLCSFLFVAFSSSIANFFQTPILAKVVKVMSLNMIIGSLIIVPSAILTRDIDFKTQSKISLVASIISGACGIMCAYSGLGVWSLVVQNIMSNLVRAIALLFVTRWLPKCVIKRESLSYLSQFGSKILVANLLHSIYCNLTTLIIGKFYTPKDLGYYSRGESIAAFPNNSITNVLQSVSYPVLAKLQRDELQLVAAYKKLLSMSSLVIFFGMFLLLAVARPLVVMLLTEKWINSVLYIQVFCIAYMFDHISYLNINLLYVKGYSNLVLRLEIIKKTISILLILSAVPLGILAICIARTIYSQIAVIINTYYSGKLFDLGYLNQFKEYAKYILFSAIASTPAFLLSFTQINSLIQIIIGGVIALIIYVILLHNDPNIKELKELLKNKVTKPGIQ